MFPLIFNNDHTGWPWEGGMVDIWASEAFRDACCSLAHPLQIVTVYYQEFIRQRTKLYKYYLRGIIFLEASFKENKKKWNLWTNLSSGTIWGPDTDILYKHWRNFLNVSKKGQRERMQMDWFWWTDRCAFSCELRPNLVSCSLLSLLRSYSS